MGIATGVVLPCVLFALAGWLARRELRLYREAAEDGDDLFVYSRARLRRRMIGLGALAAIAVTLAVLELGASATAPEIATVCGVLLGVEVLVLFAVPILDLRETARTARPGKGVKAR